MSKSHHATSDGSHVPHGPLPLLALGALGVIYGDIGTSPLYAMQVAFSSTFGMEPNEQDILGILSMFIWALIFVVTIKYVIIVTRANNKGEGGDLALQSLALRFVRNKTRTMVVIVGILAVSLFMSDAVLTPSISVLSAVEGAGLKVPEINTLAVEIALVILTALFLGQRFGTEKVGRLFGPIMLLWFVTIAAIGINGIRDNPMVVRAILPIYAFEFIVAHPLLSFGALSAVTLAITGAEALYADMGHFGRPPITLSWLLIVFPCLVLCYLGQGAMLLKHPDRIDNPFFHLVPSGVEIPVVILATVATVIASQAVISGAYSVTRQAMQLGLLPRMRVLQTSAKVRGQIFMPVITLLQYLAVVATVLIFKSSEHLAAAYGLAVTGTLVCTTILAVLVAFHLWHWPKWRIVLIFGPLGIVDVAFFTANISKIPHGAWFSLLVATILFIIISSWSTGRQAMLRALSGEAVPADEFTDKVAAGKYKRTEGTGVFLVASPTHVPRPLLATIRNFGRIHALTVLLTVETLDTPYATDANRSEAIEISPGLWRVFLRFGFAESPNVPQALEASVIGEHIDPESTSYFVGRDTVAVTTRGLAGFPRRVFALLHRHAQVSTDFFHVPPDHTVTMGARVEI
ncbi:MAG: potassium transporter Kup [Gaiellales bacterium]